MENDLNNYSIVLAMNLKPGDIIIHNYCRLKIQNCGCGKGAGNEFGEYFWIDGYRINSYKVDGFDEFVRTWSFQECPVIKCVD